MATWVMSVLAKTGHTGLALLAALECIFPPIPSELIFPLAGFLARDGRLTIWGSILAGTIGGTIGAIPLYWFGRSLGAKRVEKFVRTRGRWAAVSPDELKRAGNWFERHRGKAVLIAHVIPGMRSLIAVPAGVNHMPMTPFLIYTAVGCAVWTAILVGAGYALGASFGRIEKWLDPFSWIVVGAIVAMYAWRVARGR